MTYAHLDTDSAMQTVLGIAPPVALASSQIMLPDAHAAPDLWTYAEGLPSAGLDSCGGIYSFAAMSPVGSVVLARFNEAPYHPAIVATHEGRAIVNSMEGTWCGNSDFDGDGVRDAVELYVNEILATTFAWPRAPYFTTISNGTTCNGVDELTAPFSGDCDDDNGGAHPGLPDAPDFANPVDENCDWIDGEVARGVFVSGRYSLVSPYDPLGAPLNPYQTIQQGIDAAAADPAKDHVYVDHRVNHDESLTLPSGVSLFGSYGENPVGSDWYRTSTQTVVRGGFRTLLVRNYSSAGTIEGFSLWSADGSATVPVAQPRSSRVVVLDNVSGALVLRYNHIEAGRGETGVSGTAGTRGLSGEGGGLGANGWDGGNGGLGGTSPCGANGGAGGDGNRSEVDGEDGIRGGPLVFGRLTGGAGGAGGVWVGASGNISDPPPQACGADGRDGAAGVDGANGTLPANQAMGSWVDDGTDWRALAGLGGTSGVSNGKGGGGGGGGGGCHVGGLNLTGGGGGGGGGGGCFGTHGTGGIGAGGSIAIVAKASPLVVVEHCTFGTRGGGAGGAGGHAGIGGSGGTWRLGGSGQENPCGSGCMALAGDGGQSGMGGRGGNGGAGAGGGGGMSVGILLANSVGLNYSTGNTFTLGAAGSGGAGGFGSGADGSPGENGIAANVYTINP